jgi:hypothetical protein
MAAARRPLLDADRAMAAAGRPLATTDATIATTDRAMAAAGRPLATTDATTATTDVAVAAKDVALLAARRAIPRSHRKRSPKNKSTDDCRLLPSRAA